MMYMKIIQAESIVILTIIMPSNAETNLTESNSNAIVFMAFIIRIMVIFSFFKSVLFLLSHLALFISTV